jgi:hypothetical protein
MTRINSILESSLFTSNKCRKQLKEFIEIKLRISNNHDLLLTNLPLNYVFNTSGNFDEEICIHIRDAKMYIGFDHDAEDKVLQKLIFLFLIYSLQHYPDIDSWTDFINSDKHTKTQIIKNGIDEVWSNFQSSIIKKEINQKSEGNLPF